MSKVNRQSSRNRLDQEMVRRKLAETRSQAENIIKLGQVKLNGQVATKPAIQTYFNDKITLLSDENYVSRAGLKLASAAEKFKLDFRDKTVLDVGSSTGGFTDYALQNGAAKVIAVDVGTNQLHPKLRNNERVQVLEQTDIRDFRLLNIDYGINKSKIQNPKSIIDIILIDVSFISLRHILPAVKELCGADTLVVAMVKPQFEQDDTNQKNKGVIKNDKIRRDIFKSFENWVRDLFKIYGKADSAIAGAKGNKERFYLLKNQ